jgi:hypothetical protein
MILQDYDSNKSWCFDTHTMPGASFSSDLYSVSSSGHGPGGVRRLASGVGTTTGVTRPHVTTCHKLLDRALTQLHLNDTNVDSLAKKLWSENARRCDARNTPAIACCIYKACMLMNSERTPRAAKEICRNLVVDYKQFVKSWKTWGNMTLLADSTGREQERVSQPAPAPVPPPAPAPAPAPSAAAASVSKTPSVPMRKTPLPRCTNARDCIIRQLHQISEVNTADVYTLANKVAAMDVERRAKKQMIASPPLIVNSVLICLVMKRHGGADIAKIKKSIAEQGFASMSSLTKYVREVGKALGVQ